MKFELEIFERTDWWINLWYIDADGDRKLLHTFGEEDYTVGYKDKATAKKNAAKIRELMGKAELV